MRYTKITFVTLAIAAAFTWSCQSGTKEIKTEEAPIVKASFTKEELVKRGNFLVTIGGCNDCHSPKKMTPQGPIVDTSIMLSGHPAKEPLPPVVSSSLKPGNWILMGPDLTAFVGPWGISYPANITSDSATGIGAWKEEQFIQAMRTGKHMGLENGRPILPPMPWQVIGHLPDEDLKSIYSYLQSLPSVSNRVPGPVSPDKVVVK